MSQSFQAYVDDCYDSLNDVYENDMPIVYKLCYVAFLNDTDYE